MAKGDRIIVAGGAGHVGAHTAIEQLARTDHKQVSTYNYANSLAVTFDILTRVTGQDLEIDPGDHELIMNALADTIRSRSILSWQADHSRDHMMASVRVFPQRLMQEIASVSC